MSKAHDRDAARPVQPQTTQNLQFDLATVLTCGGGVIPRGWFVSAAMLARLAGRENKSTILDWIKEKGVPHSILGRETWLWTDHFLDAYQPVPAQSPTRKKG